MAAQGHPHPAATAARRRRSLFCPPRRRLCTLSRRRCSARCTSGPQAAMAARLAALASKARSAAEPLARTAGKEVASRYEQLMANNQQVQRLGEPFASGVGRASFPSRLWRHALDSLFSACDLRACRLPPCGGGLAALAAPSKRPRQLPVGPPALAPTCHRHPRRRSTWSRTRRPPTSC